MRAGTSDSFPGPVIILQEGYLAVDGYIGSATQDMECELYRMAHAGTLGRVTIKNK